MSTETQIALRNRLAEILLAELTGRKDIGRAIVEAATACMGATAVVIAVLPTEHLRSQVVDAVTENLLDHANKRAAEIRSGEFDAQTRRFLG